MKEIVDSIWLGDPRAVLMGITKGLAIALVSLLVLVVIVHRIFK